MGFSYVASQTAVAEIYLTSSATCHSSPSVFCHLSISDLLPPPASTSLFLLILLYEYVSRNKAANTVYSGSSRQGWRSSRGTNRSCKRVRTRFFLPVTTTPP